MTQAALVTGGRRGIGKAIALALAENGFDVAVATCWNRRNSPLSPRRSGHVGGNPPPSSRTSAVIGARQPAGQGRGGARAPDHAVNNAGVSVLSRGDLLEVTPESYDRCLAINTRGTFFLTQAFARRCAGNGSQGHRSILTVTSANAIAPSIARGEYCISKAGASMITKLFAARLSNDGIGVYEIQPGFIETDMTAPSKAKYDALIEGGLTVIKRFGTPAEVGRIAATLASGLLPYTSGQVIQADGGLLSVRY